MSYVPLNIKTGNYLLSSMIKIKDLVKVAKENGLTTLTITDNNLYGAMDFYKECINNNIKPIIGLEITIDDVKIVLYCMNYSGYQNLIKIATIMSNKVLTIDDIADKSDNLLAIVPYESRKIYNDVKKIYQYIFIGYKNDEEKSKIKSNNTVYMHEILCLNKADEKYLKYLYAIKNSVSIKEAIEYHDVSLLPLKETSNNNQKIADLCTLELKFQQNLMPVFAQNSHNLLKQKCVAGLKKIFGEKAPKKYITRLKYELETIKNMGFCDYFLIVSDYVNFAKEKGILVGPGRGSAVGSLVSYLLNITTIDPLKYDLLFERFLNPERVTMPDIDVDFEDLRRNEVINYVRDKYGEKKVAPIITFGTLGPRQVIKDVGKVLEISSKKIDILSKMLDPKISLLDNYKQPKVKNFINLHKELKELYKISIKFEGLKRHTSIHAAGVIISKCDLDEIIPLDKGHNDFYTTGYDMTYLEEIGLLKMDFLGIKNLNLISNILKEIDGLNFDDIPNDDKKAIKIFTDVNTVGIFQFESDGMMNFLRKFRPTSFEDLVAAIALFRPGPMQNIDTYIRRKQGKEKVNYIHPNLEKVLKQTYGIIIYQEQIMQIARIMAGYSFAEADILRRAMSKKKEDVLIKEKPKFISGSIKNGYSKEKATEVYELILRFASYGFNKAHSVGYALVSYKMAYLKAHYPNIFMKNLLSSAINSDIKTMEYIYECKHNNIQVVLPDINKSMDTYITSEDKILYPLTNIKNIGLSAVRIILDERKKSSFKDIFDFVRRCYGGAVTIKVIQNLILSGAFDKLGYNKKTLIDNLEVITNYGEIGEYLDDEVFKPELEIKDEYTNEELMTFELEVFGFYISNHPVTNYKHQYSNVIDLKSINSYFDKTINCIVYVQKTRIVDTKNKEKMMFFTGTDELGKIDMVMFPKVYNHYSNIENGDILLVNGKVEKRFDKLQMVVNDIKKIN